MGKLSKALMILGSTTNPQRVIDIVSPMLSDRVNCKRYPLDTYIPYLRFLQSAGLMEKSYETCYILGNYFEQKEEREKLSDFLGASPQKPSEKIMKAFILKLVEPVDSKVLVSLLSNDDC